MWLAWNSQTIAQDLDPKKETMFFIILSGHALLPGRYTE